ncbi:MAG: hypothetical protein GY906_17125 [bacterium]|nr:hypothetical protein [bacterium]
MHIRGPLIALVFGVLATTHCTPEGVTPLPVETAYKNMRETLAPLEDPAEQLLILESFVGEYPDYSEGVSALRDAIYFRRHKLDDLGGTREFAENVWRQIQNPELRFEVGLLVHELAASEGNPIDLRSIAEEIAAHRTLRFVDHLDIVEAAAKADAWQLMLEHSTAMVLFATEETFRGDYPEDDFSDGEVKHAVNRRRAWSLAYQGGALTHLGQLEEAQRVFEHAATIEPSTNYVGVPETPINRYWGQAELLLGRPERAAKLLVHDAVMGHSETALHDLEQAYIGINGRVDGFDAYLSTARQQIAKKVDDFTLPNYAGEMVSLSSMADKVIMIAFWNPG